MFEHDSLVENSIVQSNPLSNRRHFQSNVGGQYKRNGKTFGLVVNRRTWGRKREPSLSGLEEKRFNKRFDGMLEEPILKVRAAKAAAGGTAKVRKCSRRSLPRISRAYAVCDAHMCGEGEARRTVGVRTPTKTQAKKKSPAATRSRGLLSNRVYPRSSSSQARAKLTFTNCN